MKKFSVLVIFVVFLLSATSVYAVPSPPIGTYPSDYLGLYLTDGVGDNALVLSNNGQATFNGTLGNWVVNVTTAITYPNLGSTSYPTIDLDTVNVTSKKGGTMYIWASASGFSPTTEPNFVFQAGGTTSGTVEYIGYWDYFDQYLFYTLNTPILFNSGVIKTSPFAYYTSATVPVPHPAVDYTIFSEITQKGAGGTSFDGKYSAVPEPATMLLLGSGLLGMGVYARRRFSKK